MEHCSVWMHFHYNITLLFQSKLSVLHTAATGMHCLLFDGPLLCPAYSSSPPTFLPAQLSWLLTKWPICLTQVTITIYQIVFPCSLGSGGAHSPTSALLSALSSSLKRFHAVLLSMEPVKRQASLPNSSHQAICTISPSHTHTKKHIHTLTKTICYLLAESWG